MIAERLKELKFTSWCIENRTSIYVFTLIISFAGFFVYQSLPKELFPDVVVPTISVATIYPGATPEDIENLVTKPLEKQLKIYFWYQKSNEQFFVRFLFDSGGI